jgi:hypothetical protein
MSTPGWAHELRGVPVGEGWRWSDPDRPTEGETRWGVVWNRNLGEIVAVQITNGGTGRVLLLGTIREEEREAILAWLEQLARAHMPEADGLMALAWAIDGRPANKR